MEGGVIGQPGGIFGLLDLIGRHGEAIEYDLIALGLRLDQVGTYELSWRDLLIIIRHTPRTSALARAVHGEAAEWTPSTYLLALIGDQLAMGNWQRAGKKNAPKPKRIPRPGEKKRERKFGHGAIPITELNDWIAAKEAA